MSNKLLAGALLSLSTVFTGCATYHVETRDTPFNPIDDTYIIDLPGQNDFIIFPPLTTEF